MQRLVKRLCCGLFLTAALSGNALAQQALTWQEVRDKFEAANPSLQAEQIGINESRASEATAFLRPNRTLTVIADQQATGIAVSDQADLERTLDFQFRMAFVQTLQEKAVLDLGKENLTYYDHVLDVNRDRYNQGAIAQVDLNRLELQRVQYQSDLQTAEVNLRSAKIQLLVRVRETIEFSYQNGAASLLDFLNAQADYRSVQVNYLNLVASYLNAASQLNLAVGREVIP